MPWMKLLRVFPVIIVSTSLLLSCTTRKPPEKQDEYYRKYPREEATQAIKETFDPITYVIYFQPGQVEFEKEDWKTIVAVCDEWKRHRDACIKICGYADSDGNPRKFQYNQELAVKRTAWLQTCILQEGVFDKNFIKTSSQVITLPPGATPAEIKAARRGEIFVMPCLDIKTTPEQDTPPEVDPKDPFKWKK